MSITACGVSVYDIERSWQLLHNGNALPRPRDNAACVQAYEQLRELHEGDSNGKLTGLVQLIWNQCEKAFDMLDACWKRAKIVPENHVIANPEVRPMTGFAITRKELRSPY